MKHSVTRQLATQLPKLNYPPVCGYRFSYVFSYVSAINKSIVHGLLLSFYQGHKIFLLADSRGLCDYTQANTIHYKQIIGEFSWVY